MQESRDQRGEGAYFRENTVLTHLLCNLSCSWKYWQELNLVVGPKIAIATALVI